MVEETPSHQLPFKKRKRMDLTIEIPVCEDIIFVFKEAGSHPAQPETPPEPAVLFSQGEFPTPELECLEKELPKAPPPSPALPSNPEVPAAPPAEAGIEPLVIARIWELAEEINTETSAPLAEARSEPSGIASPWGLSEEGNSGSSVWPLPEVIVISFGEESSEDISSARQE